MTRIYRRFRAIACLMFTGTLALSAPAAAMQLLEAVDHAEIVCRGKAPSPSGCESRPANCRSSR